LSAHSRARVWSPAADRECHAFAVKEALRQLLDAMPATRGPLVTDRRRDAREITGADLARLRPYELRPRLQRFYEAAAAADLPEATRLANTVQRRLCI